MADHTTVSVEEQRQVAISVCSTPSDRSLAVAAGSVSTPRSNTNKLVPLYSLKKLMLKSPAPAQADVHDDEQTRVVPAEVPLAKKVAAEFIGTFILMFAVVSTVVADAQHGGAEGLVGVAAAAGLAVVAVVLAVVHVSGSHLNPAVSLAMAVFGHLPRAHVLPYATAQTMGSAAATFLAKGVYRPADPAVMATVPSVGAAQAFFLELVLMFVITAVATDPTLEQRTGGHGDRGGGNDERSHWRAVDRAVDEPGADDRGGAGDGKYQDIWVYLLAPPLGGIAGAATYTLIKP